MRNIYNLLLRWKEVILITVSTRLLLFILTIFVNHKLTNIFYPWVQWDGPHYIDIAKNWYQSSGQQSLWIVFYPLYPILIKFFNIFINDFMVSAIVVSLVFSLVAPILLFELALLDFKKNIALLSVWFLNIFPTSYFLQASYTESVFLTLSLAAVYFFRKEKFTFSGIAGFLATMTRLNGILLLPILLMETKSIKKSAIAFILTPLGFLSYMLINYLTFKNPLFFVQPLYSNWYKRFGWPWIGLKNIVLSIPSISNVHFYVYFSEVIAIIFILIFGIYVFFKIRKSYGVYIFLNFILLTSTSFIISTPRYAVVLFPIYLALAKISHKIIILEIISLVFILLLIYFSQIYTKGQWAF